MKTYFDTRYVPHGARDQVWQHVTRYLENHWKLSPQSHVLELGTGYGSWIRAIRAAKKEALDLHPELPKLFIDRQITDVVPHVGSCTDLSQWNNRSFDLVLASNLLEHLTFEESAKCMLEIYRVLKPGGQVCLIKPNFALCPRKYFDDFTHRTIFTHVSLNDFSSAHGFETVKLWKRFLPLTMKSSGSHLSFLVPFYLRSPIKPLAGQMCLIARRKDD